MPLCRSPGRCGVLGGPTTTTLRPAATMVAVAGFVDPAMLVEVEVDAYRA